MQNEQRVAPEAPEQKAGARRTGTEQQQDGAHNTAMAIIAYIIFFVPLLTDARDDPFVKYHVKQGLVLFLSWVVVSFVVSMISFLYVIAWILHLALLVLLVIGIMHAVNGERRPLPVIGKFAEHFKF